MPLLAELPLRRGGRTLCGAAALALLPGLALPVLAQAPQPPASYTVVKMVFSNGESVDHPVGRGGEIWLPRIPPLTGSRPSHEGEPLSGLGLTYQVEGQAVVATVFLTFGERIRFRVKLAPVTLTPTPVVVDELRAHGVLPVRLSLASVSAAPLRGVKVESVSKDLTLTVTPLGSQYSVTITNASVRTAHAVRVDVSGDGAAGVSTLQRGQRGEAVVGPKASATFVMPGIGGGPSSAPGSPGLIAITAVVWADGFEGDPSIADIVHKLREEERRALERVLPVLKQAKAGSAPELRARLSSISAVSEGGGRRVVEGLLTELTRAAGPLPLDGWLATTIPIYEQWLARLSGSTR